MSTEFGVLEITPADIDGFLGFLDESEMWAWAVEFQALQVASWEEEGHWARQFLRLRSLAMLTEPIMQMLVERYGDELVRTETRNASPAGQVTSFLRDDVEWQKRLCETIKGCWKLDRSREPRDIPLPEAFCMD